MSILDGTLTIYMRPDNLNSYLNGQEAYGYITPDKNSWRLEIPVSQIIEVNIQNNSVLLWRKKH